jgi:hypothetical protein
MYRVLSGRLPTKVFQEIVAYVSRDNADAAEKLGHELLDRVLFTALTFVLSVSLW